MDKSIVDRRTDTRFYGSVLDALRMTLRPGCLLSVINLSAGGALVHAGRPLRPGAHVHLHLVTPTRSFALRAQLLRCTVASLSADAGVVYSGAMRFEDRCNNLWESCTHDGYPVPAAFGSVEAFDGQQLPAEPEIILLSQV